MPRLVAVSRERHGQKKWLRFKGYAFAAANAVAPIVGAELARAPAILMPSAFLQHSGRYMLVSVLSATPGRNMFVGSDGRWLGPYVPACFRLYPFCMVAGQG